MLKTNNNNDTDDNNDVNNDSDNPNIFLKILNVFSRV